ncbi:MAG: transglutaminase family protein [Polyangiaceae bacterium]|nr:transglutaminase family protein [Polyangiaceae bacterium]
MPAPVSLTLFAHVVARPEEELDLAEAALLIGDTEYPRLDVPRYLSMLDRMGDEARRALDTPRDAPEAAPGSGAIDALLVWLYGRQGFRGNAADYYDPRNSYLNEVLERRVGIPITLAVVLLEICRRAGIEAQGVSFPGHFLVRTPGRGGLLLVDPFEGRLLGREDLRALHARATGVARDPDARMLAAAPKRLILVRMLNNLRAIYGRRPDPERLRRVLELIQVLSPTDELRRELEQLGGDRPWPSRGRSLN